jgi:hypothetical protein
MCYKVWCGIGGSYEAIEGKGGRLYISYQTELAFAEDDAILTQGRVKNVYPVGQH